MAHHWRRELQKQGHRVVHGGEKFTRSVTISDEVVDQIEKVATGRKGMVSPSICVVSPTQAWSMNSLAMRRMCAAGTSQTACAHSGE